MALADAAMALADAAMSPKLWLRPHSARLSPKPRCFSAWPAEAATVSVTHCGSILFRDSTSSISTPTSTSTSQVAASADFAAGRGRQSIE